uniref:Uncharacterized protein n=1 Tax=Solanum lycopersicum TaxID=4081 RepID=A0A3Q7I084_SOLLC
MNWVEHYEKDPKAAMAGLLNMMFEILKCFVFLMNEASFNHGEREALRSYIKALNFWATEIWWELQDFTLNILKRIIDELIINEFKSSVLLTAKFTFSLGRDRSRADLAQRTSHKIVTNGERRRMLNLLDVEAVPNVRDIQAKKFCVKNKPGQEVLISASPNGSFCGRRKRQVTAEMTDCKFDLSVKCTGHIDVCFLSLNFLDCILLFIK